MSCGFIPLTHIVFFDVVDHILSYVREVIAPFYAFQGVLISLVLCYFSFMVLLKDLSPQLRENIDRVFYKDESVFDTDILVG